MIGKKCEGKVGHQQNMEKEQWPVSTMPMENGWAEWLDCHTCVIRMDDDDEHHGDPWTVWQDRSCGTWIPFLCERKAESNRDAAWSQNKVDFALKKC